MRGMAGQGDESDEVRSVWSDSTGYSSDEDRDASRPSLTTPMIVVSNRLPFVLKRTEEGNLVRQSSAGGLVTAVAPVVVDCQGVWVGWTGLADYSHLTDNIPESSPGDMAPTAGLRSSNILPVTVRSQAVFDSYYNGCCNATFWPLFHSMPDKAVFNIQTWQSYSLVNQDFALKTLEAIRKYRGQASRTPLVWLHDYHLMLAANTIRDVCVEEEINVRMSFFLHIPFPSWDIMRIFPWSDEILQGMLGCDMVGFHTEDYCINFLDCCQRSLGCRVDRNKMLIEHCGRTVMVKAMPIGIPYDRFETMSKLAMRVYACECKVILGVDRLDYTKGLISRLKSFQRLLVKYPKWIGKVLLLQVAVPSRTDVQEYKELKEDIDKLVGCINGQFSTPAWSPIRYIFGCVKQDELAAFYRDATVGLITPLRDGMNLVAKEFVACQPDRDPGVLILSPFAGAGGLMQEALQVNPYEVENVADTLNRALEMPLDERQLRMNQLKKRERRMNVEFWVNSFLQTMGGIYDEKQDESHHTEQYIDKLDVEDFEQNLGGLVDNCTKLGVILDFDGTLSYLAQKPALAIIPAETKKALEMLAQFSDCKITVISGRNILDLQRKVGVEGITYAGNHGLEILHPDGTRFTHPMPIGFKERLFNLEKDLRESCTSDGAWVEPKGLLVAWHYREVPRDKREDLLEQASGIYKKHNFDFFNVSKRLENIPPLGWDRGRSSIHILRSIFGIDWEDMVQVIYAGDSAADEFAMEALAGVAYTFKVINEDATALTKTWANSRLQGPDAVLTMLKFLQRKLAGRKVRPLRVSLCGVEPQTERLEVVIDDEADSEAARPRSKSLTAGSISRKKYQRTLSLRGQDPDHGRIF